MKNTPHIANAGEAGARFCSALTGIAPPRKDNATTGNRGEVCKANGTAGKTDYSHSAGAREKFLALVDHKTTGRDHGMFRVPTRRDKNMSGTWRELPDGRLLIHDFGGESVDTILAAIGLTLSDLFPERIDDYQPKERRPFPAADVLRAVGFEALVVLMAATSIRKGEPLSRQDNDRLLVSVQRLQSALTLAGVRHG